MKKRIHIVGLFVVAGMLLSLFFLTRHIKEPLLLDHARKLTDCRDWVAPPGITYFWLPDNQLLFCKESSPHSPAQSTTRLFRRNLVTLADTPLPAFSRIWVESANCLDCGHFDAQVSSKGDAMLWNDGWGGTWLASLDGKRQHRGDGNQDSILFSWLTDGKAWIEFPPNPLTRQINFAKIHPLDTSLPVLRLPVTSTVPLPTKNFAILFASGATADFASEENMGDNIHAGHGDMLHFAVGLDHVALQSAPIRLPPGMTRLEAWRGSPGGARIAWLYEYAHYSGMAQWLNRLHSPWHIPPQLGWSLQVSNWDGSHLHNLGDYPRVPTSPAAYPINDLRWLPEGKHLSFRLGDALYVVPASE